MSLTPFAYDLDEAQIRRERQKSPRTAGQPVVETPLRKGGLPLLPAPDPPGELTMDHIVPVARGGRSTRGNIVPCCKECNIRKKQLLPMEWDRIPVPSAFSESSRI